MNIRTKLTLSFLLVALLVGVLGFFGYSNLKDTANQVDVITERETPAIDRLFAIKSQVLDRLEKTGGFFGPNEPAGNAGLVDPDSDVSQSDSTFGESREIATVREGGQEAESRLLEQAVIARLSMAAAFFAISEDIEQDQEINQSDLATFEAAIDDSIRAIALFLELENREVVAAQQDIQDTLTGSIRLTIIVVSVAVVLAISLGLLLSRSILVPIYKLRDVADELGGGNLSVRSDVESGDEIGSLAKSFNQMAGARQQVEEQRRILIEELEFKNAKLEEAYEELQSLDKMKDEFISNVSHELRTPLTSIKSAAEILLRYPDEDPEIQEEFLGIINTESDRLTRLINDVLDLSRMASGEIEWRMSTVNLLSVIETAVDGTHAITVQKNVTVEIGPIDGLPTVESDPDKLVQIITNLLSNAIKFTPSGGLIQVRSRLLPHNNPATGVKMAEVSVADNGVGIPAVEQTRIFDRFQQSGTTLSGRPQGTGLGLAISKEIVARLGGEIWVESELGTGSTFFFTFPVTGVAN